MTRTCFPSSSRTTCKILDRWSDSTNQHAIRYYRWKNEYYTEAGRGLPNPAPTPDQVGKVCFWRVPVEIGGNASPLIAPANPDLRNAEYAIVSPGPDGDFTTMADNIMELGR